MFYPGSDKSNPVQRVRLLLVLVKFFNRVTAARWFMFTHFLINPAPFSFGDLYHRPPLNKLSMHTCTLPSFVSTPHPRMRVCKEGFRALGRMGHEPHLTLGSDFCWVLPPFWCLPKSAVGASAALSHSRGPLRLNVGAPFNNFFVLCFQLKQSIQNVHAKSLFTLRLSKQALA